MLNEDLSSYAKKYSHKVLGASRIKKATAEISTLFNASIFKAIEQLRKAADGLLPPESAEDLMKQQVTDRNEKELKAILSKGGVPLGVS